MNCILFACISCIICLHYVHESLLRPLHAGWHAVQVYSTVECAVPVVKILACVKVITQLHLCGSGVCQISFEAWWHCHSYGWSLLCGEMKSILADQPARRLG